MFARNLGMQFPFIYGEHSSYSSISVLFISDQGLSYYYVFNMVRESIDPCTYSNSQFRPLEVTESTPLDIMYELITCLHEFCIYDFFYEIFFIYFFTR